MANDVEKRMTDGPTYRHAATYVGAVLGAMAVVFIIVTIWAAHRTQCADQDTDLCDTQSRTVVLMGPTAILMLGGIGAFILTYRCWRRGGRWPIWQGAGWFLFTLMLVYLVIGGGAAAG